MVVGDKAVIVDDSKISRMYGSALRHYKNGTVVTIKSIMMGLVEIEINKSIIPISLDEADLSAIELIK